MTSIHTKNFSPGTNRSSAANVPSKLLERLGGTHRLEGPALPPNGTPTHTPSLERLNERLERLAFGGRPEGHDAPPLETYTTTPTEHGDVVRATPEYVRWFHRTYPAAGPEDRARVQAPGPDPQGYGAGGVTF